MSLLNSKRGSEWRRWDLHLHTPGTKLADSYGDEEDVWDRYIDILENSSVQAFGITDYFSADGYFDLAEKYAEKYPNSDKIFFPNIEFRLVEAISATNSNPHIHVLFDNDETVCSKESIKRFLSTLMTSGENENGVRVSCADLGSNTEFESASISLENLRSALKDTFGESTPYLIAFPAKNDGVRSTDSSSPRKVLINDKIDKAAHLFFGDSSSRDYFLKLDRYETGQSEAKPVVSGSDAHSFDDLERLEGNVSGYEPTWLKSDLTFRGLRQIVFEPVSRIYIGSEPLVEQRKSNQATKFVANLSVNQIEGYNQLNGQWFNGVDIPINPELTAIIGNKGSGKSALVDIVGLLGHSRQEAYFSFLSNDKDNRKFKQRGYAEKFVAELEWESAVKISKNLNDNVDFSKPESVRYLPQNYFEKLTNEIEIQAFRHEIEDVVFSHVDETDRMGKTSFSDLQEFKTQQSTQETSTLKAALRELNIEIIRLEEKASPLHRRQVDGLLEVKREELRALDNTKPSEVSKPDTETEEQKLLSAEISRLTVHLDGLERSDRETVDVIAQKKGRLQKLTSLEQSVSSVSAQIAQHKLELTPVCSELGLDINAIISAEIKAGPIAEQTRTVLDEIQVLETDNKCEYSQNMDFKVLVSLPDLRAAYIYVQDQITQLKDRLGTPQRKYQTYVEKLTRWKAQREIIIGADVDPKPETIRYLEQQITYIDNELSPTLTEACLRRRELCESIYNSKNEIVSFYSELKQSVEAKLGAVRTQDFSVNIDASFILDQSFEKSFLNFINKTKKGPFIGRNDPQQLIGTLIGEVDWNNFDSLYTFIETILEKMKLHEGDRLSITEQVSDVKEFYDFLFSIGYLSASYELRLGDKNLNELSPGEKGLLLLVFYLQLDKDNIPLIIDQPEDNLDNESIFTVLAQCIREAKRNRQVILVTHNPNLAVGADAEQIVYVQLEKSQNYKFSYESGAIENPRINQKIVDVLEGTQPAFVKRRLKYQI